MISDPVGYIVIARHFETSKNERRIHGDSKLAEHTVRGQRQAVALAQTILNLDSVPAAIRCANTPQCVQSAHLLSRLTGIPNMGILDLHPYRLGIIDGLSDQQVEERYPELARRLRRFRIGALDANGLEIPGAECMLTLEARIRKWWADSREILRDSILILSRSTILMAHAALHGTYPSTGEYFDLALPNGGARIEDISVGVYQNSEENECCQDQTWPLNQVRYAEWNGARIAYTLHWPAYFRRMATIVIVPGLFGNSRLGPYNLYSSISSHLAAQGYRSVVYDPIGSGESTPLPRSFEDDVASLQEVLGDIGCTRVILIGHSAGALIAGVAAHTLPIPTSVIALAPITTDQEVLPRIDESDRPSLNRTVAVRKGVQFYSDYVEKMKSHTMVTFSHVILGEVDTYVNKVSLDAALGSCPRTVIPAADHNFSATAAKAQLLEKLATITESCEPNWRLRT